MTPFPRNMAIGKTLVSYDSIVKPFPDKQTLLAKAREQAGKVIADPVKADAYVSQLSDGIESLQLAQSKFPQVLHTPRNSTASLLQAHVAQQATQENKLDQLILKGVEFVLEAFEVKFSSDDFIGWMASFFTWIDGLVPAAYPRPAEPRLILDPDWDRVGRTADGG
jgi:hypothetical protein